jgi:hypothetical protein
MISRKSGMIEGVFLGVIPARLGGRILFNAFTSARVFKQQFRNDLAFEERIKARTSQRPDRITADSGQSRLLHNSLIYEPCRIAQIANSRVHVPFDQSDGLINARNSAETAFIVSSN